MIKSMTGFASVNRDDARAAVGLTIRAVNHRFLDLQLRMPSSLAILEAGVRGAVQKRLARGRVEVSLSVQMRTVPVPDVQLNEEFGRALAGVVERARSLGIVTGPLTPGDLLRLPQALLIAERSAEAAAVPDDVAAMVMAALDDALDQLEAMRAHEGDHLRRDFDVRTLLLADLVSRIVQAADTGRGELEARLLDRARELAAVLPIDQAALSQEVVRVAQRSDISEEVTRFRGHLVHWAALADSPEPCGRKLDFLLQEMNREINTIGSKADGLQISEVVIQAKAELERMREQVQNVE